MQSCVPTPTSPSNRSTITKLRPWFSALFVAASAVGLSGCFMFMSTTPIDEKLYDEHMKWTFNYPADACLDATAKALEDSRVPVDKIDRETRTVWSGRGVVNEYARGSAGSSVAEKFTTEHRWTLEVVPAGAKCVVRTSRYEVWGNNVKADEVLVSYAEEHVFEPMRRAIEDRLERGF